MSSLLETLQADLHARLAADPFFSDVDVVLARPRAKVGFVEIQTRVDSALAGLRKTNGKSGAALAVLMPDAAITDPDAPGPRMEITFTVRVQELPIINMGTGGTGKSAEELAMRVMQLGHQFNAGQGATLYGKDINPLPATEGTTTLGLDVTFSLKSGAAAYAKAAAPLITSTAPTTTGVITFTVPEDAICYYTVDGSYPTADSIEYEDPFTPTDPCQIRAISLIEGKQQSNISTMNIVFGGLPIPPAVIP
jgi:hypothetical protein